MSKYGKSISVAFGSIALAGALLLTTIVAGGTILRAAPGLQAVASPQATVPALGSTPPVLSASTVPVFSHVYVIVMENHELSNLLESSQAPYINRLSADYGLASNYHAVAHPSLPNYLALFSGSTQGATSDATRNIDGANLADQLEAHGKTWRVYAQNYPLNCFTGSSASGGTDGPGTYARKHNPAISFLDISQSSSRCANISDLAHFDPSAADYELIVPNLCNDMHDCGVSSGDTFLENFVPKILASDAWTSGGVLFVVWDEGVTNEGVGGRVPLMVISSQVPKGMQSATAHDHYSLLRTIEDAWNLGCLNLTCSANNLAEFFPQGK